MKQRYFVIDIAKCIGCFNCLVSCKDEHVGNDWPNYTLPQKRHEQKWIEPEPVERGVHPMIDVAYLPKVCNHCEDAPCLRKSSGAIIKRSDGVILIDPVKAKGKGDLSELCPYGMISWNDEQQISQKCTFCAHLLDDGWEKPRCVQACPLEALRMEYVEPQEMERKVKMEGLEVLHPEYRTKPHVYYKNLYRITKCFIGGSVVFYEKSLEYCLSGCEVTLKKDGKVIGEQRTDAFGDFKFDQLKKNSGKYLLEFRKDGFSKVWRNVTLTTSTYIGTVVMEQKSS